MSALVVTAILTPESAAADRPGRIPTTPELPADSPGWEMAPFVKRKEPILRPTPDSRFQCPIRGQEVRWEEQNVYNPAAVERDGKVYLLYRADDQSPDLKWGRTCRIGLAYSEDGISFTRHSQPVLYPDNDTWKPYEWEGGCEDLHIIEDEGGTYYLNYTTWNGERDTLSVATSRDLYHWTKHGPAFRKAAPEKVYGSRSGVVVSRLEGNRLIAAKIRGKYWMYYTHPCALAWSDNLIDWTPTSTSVWGGSHEAGAIALLREDGILLMFQGPHASLGAWTLGQALIDRNDLTTVLRQQDQPFLHPELDWEKKGFVGRTTVANGLVHFKGQWLLYYGAADRVIGLATCTTKGTGAIARTDVPDWGPPPSTVLTRPKLEEPDPRAAERRKAWRAVENALLYQRHTGGWPKGYDRDQELTEAQRTEVMNDESKNDSMIDNGATHTEIRLLADAFQKTRDERFKEAALRGIRYLLDGQYDNGGWPQQFPDPRGYARYITFNDHAMIGVMSLLRDVAQENETYSFVPEQVRDRCRKAVERGIQCILKCQIRIEGKPTVWCAQHDQVTFEPRQARSYELASLSGAESVGVVRFLMQIETPSEEVIRAIEGAVAWFERSKLEGIKVVRVKDAAKPKGYDRVVVEDPKAPPMWARFYDLQTNEPMFCSRDGIPRRTLAEISHERRNGYSWLGYYAQGLLERDLPAWRKRLGRDNTDP